MALGRPEWQARGRVAAGKEVRAIRFPASPRALPMAQASCHASPGISGTVSRCAGLRRGGDDGTVEPLGSAPIPVRLFRTNEQTVENDLRRGNIEPVFC